MNDNLSTYFPDGGLFANMPSAPWSAVAGTGETLDLMYFDSYSGEKPASNFVVKNSVKPEPQKYIAAALWSIFGNSWSRLWDAAQITYEQIQNYSMEETVDRTGGDDRTIDRSRDDAGTSKDVTSGTTENTGSTTQDNATFGFNSADPVPTAKATGTSTDTTTESSTIDGQTKNTTTETTIDTLKQTENTTTHRFGNIGVTTSQQMLQQEFDLWKWHFYKQIFDDADKFLTLSVYPSCSQL